MSGEQHKIVGIGMGIAGSYFALTHGAEFAATGIAVGSALGCWLPDMDHDRTKLGRKRKVVTEGLNKLMQFGLMAVIVLGMVLVFLLGRGLVESPISPQALLLAVGGAIGLLVFKKIIENSSEYKWATKHRGLMHTLLPLIPIWLLTQVSDFPLWDWFAIGLLVGYISHLIADCTTTEGCPIFYPLAKFNFRVPIFNTDSKRAIGCWILAIVPNIIVFLINKYF